MGKITAVILTYNEQKNIERCLKSLSFVQEIILVDNSSIDKTVQIAKKYTNKIIFNKNDPTKIDMQKNIGFEKATGEWILSIDADEEVSLELAKAIKEKIDDWKDSGENSVNGYWIPRKNIIFGKWIQYSGWYPDYQLRLFRRGKGKFTKIHVHEPLSLEGKSEYLKETLTHYNYDSVSHFMRKAIDVYIPNEAKNMLDGGYVFSYTGVIKFPLQEFLRRFFAQKGYKDGFHGLMLALLMAFYHFLIFAEIWETEKFKQLDEEETVKLIKNGIEESNRELSYWEERMELERINSPLGKMVNKIIRKFRD